MTTVTTGLPTIAVFVSLINFCAHVFTAGVTNLFETVSYFLCTEYRRATSSVHTSEIKILLNVPSVILVQWKPLNRAASGVAKPALINGCSFIR